VNSSPDYPCDRISSSACWFEITAVTDSYGHHRERSGDLDEPAPSQAQLLTPADDEPVIVTSSATPSNRVCWMFTRFLKIFYLVVPAGHG
jgi:hypothetical protein